MTKTENLRRRQLDRQLQAAADFGPTPKSGWIRTIREALGMSLTQMAKRIGVVKSVASGFERREREGGLTLKSLRRAADALECDLVYTLVPREGSLAKTIESRALAIAMARVARTSHSMDLENQDTRARLEDAIEDVKRELMTSDIQILWDESL